MKEIFWNSISNYNESTWIVQSVIVAAAVILVLLLFFRPSAAVRNTMKVFMIFLSLWIAFAYYMHFGSVRDYHYVMTIFWTMMALSWVYDLITGHSTFERKGRRSVLGVVTMLMPFLYPAVSLARGLEFPAITTPVIPSSVALFMLGVLLTFPVKVNFFAFLFILHWAVVDISKIFLFGIPEDILLAVACIPAMILFFKDAAGPDDGKYKPSWKVVMMLVAAVSAIITLSLAAELCLN